MKKRGFGEGKFNGVGGKVEEGETILQTTVREAKEEIGVDVDERNIQQVGTIAFSFDGKPGGILCRVFFTTEWRQEPVETDEMAPQWFAIADIPYDQMWIDDQYWLPMVLGGSTIQASFLFNAAGTALLEKKILIIGQHKRIAYGGQN